MTANERKQELITKILDQDTYMPNSGMYIQIAEGLMKLSRIELSQLDTIISMKLIDRGGKRRGR